MMWGDTTSHEFFIIGKKFTLTNRGGCTDITEVGIPENGEKLKKQRKLLTRVIC